MKRLAVGLLVLAAVGCKKGPDSSAPRAKGDPGAIGTAADFAPEGGAEAPAAEEAEDSAVATAPRDRSRLGTEFGETRQSMMTSVPFTRGDNRQPDITLALLYDDLDGVRAMAQRNGEAFQADSSVSTDDGSFVLTVVDGNGEVLTGADIAGRRYAIGSAGQRYSIGIENHSSERFEVVASVDGLDVIDGEEAGFHKRGYVLEPLASVMIDGWRTSEDTVAAFRFGNVADSYAERRGKGRNIGVIGAAFFHERGGVAWRDLHRADPFPSRFAPPPPPRRF
jgi:hypothetical protein